MIIKKGSAFRVILLVFIFLSVLATVKICFLNVNLDEEYAITLSWRILSEDQMFRDIWEPHQTSGFLTAGLCWIYKTITGTSEYLVLYLRICGALLQAGISVFLYRTLKMSFSRFGALTAAFFFFNLLPKQIQAPEFSNMLVWFSVLAMLCFFRTFHSKHCYLWLTSGGIFLCGLVLAYPSCILAVPVCFLCLRKLRPETFRRDAGILLAICSLLGFGYIAFFLSHMTPAQFLFGVRQMMTDAAHSSSLMRRLRDYVAQLLTLLPHLCSILIFACPLFLVYRWLVIKRGVRYYFSHLFLCCILCISFAEQVLIWGKSRFFHYPLLYFYLLYFAGICVYLKKRLQNKPQYRTLFWFGTVWGGSVWLTALLITNTTISITGSYLICGLLSAIVLLVEETEMCLKENGENGGMFIRLPVLLTALGLLGTTLFAKGYMVCMSQGWRTDVFVVRQKNLSGPAKNIYSIYMEGHDYNSYAELMEGCYTAEDSLLYVGDHSLYYLVTECRISVHSTISTPSFDERLLEYWSCFPEHYPTLVVLDLNSHYQKQFDFIKETLELKEPLTQNDNFIVWRVNPIFD